LTTGFDIETEFSIHCLEMNLPVAEIPSTYGARQEGSTSKLNTYVDGIKILWRISMLLKEVRPFFFFGLIGLLFTVLSFSLGYPIIKTYLETGLVPRLPTAILCVGTMLMAAISLICGLILSSLSYARREAKRLCYLSYPLFKE
jgi:hypothetical protein